MNTDAVRSRDWPEDAIVAEALALRQDYPDEAVTLLEDFLATHPVSLRVRLHLAALYADDYGLGIAGAERLYREILQDYPDCVPAMWSLGLLHGHPHSSVTSAESLELLGRAASLTEDPDLVRNLANKAWEAGEVNQAVAAFQRLKSIAPESRRSYFDAIADDAITKIRRGDRASGLVFTWPEIG
jgi:tetratricopeptide (TPR) repeat protein